jgi:hypothetical protein
MFLLRHESFLIGSVQRRLASVKIIEHESLQPSLTKLPLSYCIDLSTLETGKSRKVVARRVGPLELFQF